MSQPVDKSRTVIDVTVGDQNFTFVVTPSDVENYLNASNPNDKISPAHNLLVSTVTPDQKTGLLAIVNDEPMLVLEVAGLILLEVKPKVRIAVKKR